MSTLYRSLDAIESGIIVFSRIVVIVSGIALTVVMTLNVVARYMSASGGFSFAQELPVLIFPWFILAGIVLAAHAGAHMAVEWIYEKLDKPGKVAMFVVANAVSAITFLVLAYEAVLVAEIAAMERSPVLQLPNSIGYYALAIGAFLVAIVTITTTLKVVRFGWDSRVVANVEEVPL